MNSPLWKSEINLNFTNWTFIIPGAFGSQGDETMAWNSSTWNEQQRLSLNKPCFVVLLSLGNLTLFLHFPLSVVDELQFRREALISQQCPFTEHEHHQSRLQRLLAECHQIHSKRRHLRPVWMESGSENAYAGGPFLALYWNDINGAARAPWFNYCTCDSPPAGLNHGALSGRLDLKREWHS